MDRNELTLKVAHRWTKILGGSLTDKAISIRFLMSGSFSRDWLVDPRLNFVTWEPLVRPVAHIFLDGKPIPEEEMREVVLRNSFDSIEITIYQVPEENQIPEWVEEEYFTRGILEALLKLRYPDWDESQRTDYEKKLLEKKRSLDIVSILRVPLYICLLTLAVLSIDLVAFWMLNGLRIMDDMTNLSFTIMLEGLIMAIFGFSLTRVRDMPTPWAQESPNTYVNHLDPLHS